MSTPKNVVKALKEMRLSPPRANHSKTKKNRNSQNALNTYFEELDKYGNNPMTPKKRENFYKRFEGLWEYHKGFPRLKNGRRRSTKKNR
jgi:hypothetical protein